MTARTQEEALKFLREEVPAHQVGKKPKLNCRECGRKGGNGECPQHKKARCPECKQWISTAHVHLDFFGHAEATDRLLDADLEWNWEPLARTPEGLPLFDKTGGLWIKLTVAGVTRIGYGTADNGGGFKNEGDVIKEIIGDAIRNGSMRFGVALNLWAKSDLHADEHEYADVQQLPKQQKTRKAAQGSVQRSKPAEPDGEWTGGDAPMADVPATMAQLNMLNTLVSKKRGNLPREQRLAFVAQGAGRPLESSKDLTKREASSLIERLNAMPDFVPPPSEEQREQAAQNEAEKLAATDPESDSERVEEQLRESIESADSNEELLTAWTSVEAAQAAGSIGDEAIEKLKLAATRREDKLKADQGWSQRRMAQRGLDMNAPREQQAAAA